MRKDLASTWIIRQVCRRIKEPKILTSDIRIDKRKALPALGLQQCLAHLSLSQISLDLLFAYALLTVSL